MNRALLFFLVFSIGLHLALAGLWPVHPSMSAGQPHAIMLLSLQRPPEYKASSARRPHYPESSSNPSVQENNIALAPTNRPELRSDDSIAVQDAPASINTVTRKNTSSGVPEDTVIQPETVTIKQISTRSHSNQHDNALEHTPQINAALRRQLAVNFVYPRLARRRGLEGDVLLGLRLEADGNMSNIRIVRSSGHPILDRSAVRSAEHAGRTPDITQWLAGQHLDMVLPVHFRLIDS